jgi:hypothetical protein
VKGVRRAVQIVAVRTDDSPAGILEALAAAEIAPPLLGIDAVTVALVLDGDPLIPVDEVGAPEIAAVPPEHLLVQRRLGQTPADDRESQQCLGGRRGSCPDLDQCGARRPQASDAPRPIDEGPQLLDRRQRAAVPSDGDDRVAEDDRLVESEERNDVEPSARRIRDSQAADRPDRRRSLGSMTDHPHPPGRSLSARRRDVKHRRLETRRKGQIPESGGREVAEELIGPHPLGVGPGEVESGRRCGRRTDSEERAAEILRSKSRAGDPSGARLGGRERAGGERSRKRIRSGARHAPRLPSSEYPSCLSPESVDTCPPWVACGGQEKRLESANSAHEGESEPRVAHSRGDGGEGGGEKVRRAGRKRSRRGRRTRPWPGSCSRRARRSARRRPDPRGRGSRR